MTNPRLASHLVTLAFWAFGAAAVTYLILFVLETLDQMRAGLVALG